MEQNEKTVTNFLEHYGVLGMKWGVRRTPEELGHKPKSTEKKKSSLADRVEKLKEERAKKKAAEARKKAKEAAAEKAKERAKILENPKLLYKHRKEFTKDEIDSAIKDFNRDKQLYELSQAYIKRGSDFLNNITKYASGGTAAYNSVVKIYNSFTDGQKLPLIDTGGK